MTPDTPQTPPPYVPRPAGSPQKFNSVKICHILLINVVLMIGLLFVWVLSDSRDSTSRRVSDEIASQWGGNIRINGPLAKVSPDSFYCIVPEVFDCEVTVKAKSLHRGIYEAEVFDADIVISGSFSRDSIAALGDTVCLWLQADPRQITRPGTLKFGGREYVWQKGENGVTATVDVASLPADIDFSTTFGMRGSGAVYVCKSGRESSISIQGEAMNPSFHGSSLPDDRLVYDREFKASWHKSSYDTMQDDDNWVCTHFLVGVDRYMKVNRALKYGFLIILLTFASVLFVEIMMRHTIPLFNYFLIGAALLLFYTLLLAISEHVAFAAAYGIAAVMTVALISGYMWMMLRSRKVGLGIAALLTMMYTVCYIMLCLSTYALLAGSLILFVTLAAMMWGSLKIRY